MPAVIAAIATSLIGGAASSQGGKKAAGNAQPNIPREIAPALQAAFAKITQGFQNPGGLTAGFTPQQRGFFGSGGSVQNLLDTGGQGLQQALKTSTDISQRGVSDEDLQDIEAQLGGLQDRSRARGVAAVRERGALGGRTFGTGGQSQEADFIQGFEAQTRAETLNAAVPLRGLQLQGANATAGIFGSGAQTLSQLFGLSSQEQAQEQRGIDAPFALLSSLLGSGGTPFFTPPVASTFGQTAGAQIGQLGSSPGFLQLLGNKQPSGQMSTGGSATRR